MDLKQDFESIIEEAVRGTGKELRQTATELAVYAAERAAHLSTLVGEKGFEQAVRAERDAVALRAGVETHRRASDVDQRLTSALHVALLLGAKALARA